MQPLLSYDMGLLSRLGILKKSIPMRGSVTHVEEDAMGNYWFLSNLFGSKNNKKLYFDMQGKVGDEYAALLACTPFYTVVDKIGSMMSRGTPYIVDKNGNEKKSFSDIRGIILNPNPLQTFNDFIQNIEINMKVFGFCPIVMVRATETSCPRAMWIVPPENFHITATGNVFRQFEKKEIIKDAYIEWEGKQISLDESEYFIIYDSTIKIAGANQDITFQSPSDSLSQPISNWVAAMSASYTLMVNGGPKGILCSSDKDEMGYASVTSKEEKEIKDKFKRDYGLVGKEYPVLVSRFRLSWVPLDYNSEQLKLFEEDKRCTEKISNALGVNPNLFSDAKYDNQESAKKAAYQDLIIPDSRKIANCMTKAICPEGVFVKIDFSDVECLQSNKGEEANTLVKVADALQRLLDKSLITHEEARIEVSKYIDIDPERPKGEFDKDIKKEGDKNDSTEDKDGKE